MTDYRAAKRLSEFLQFNRVNPEVYTLFDRFTREALRTGRDHYGVEAVMNRLRWHTEIETVGDDYKINNNYKSFYGRLWVQRNPRHQGFFRERRSMADGLDLITLVGENNS